MTLVDVIAGVVPAYAGFTVYPQPPGELTDFNWNDFSTPGFVTGYNEATITFDLGGLINIDTLQYMIKYQLWGSWYAGECPSSAIYVQLFDGTSWVQAHADVRSPVCGVPGRTYYNSGLQTINLTFPYKYLASIIQIKLVVHGSTDNPANASISGTRIMAYSDVYYREADLVSCQFPSSAVTGQPVQVTATINQGSMTENYKLVFSGDLTGESAPFIVNAGTGQEQVNVTITFTTSGTKNMTASLVKV